MDVLDPSRLAHVSGGGGPTLRSVAARELLEVTHGMVDRMASRLNRKGARVLLGQLKEIARDLQQDGAVKRTLPKRLLKE